MTSTALRRESILSAEYSIFLNATGADDGGVSVPMNESAPQAAKTNAMWRTEGAELGVTKLMGYQ
jgi:hypothetical protein